MKDLLDRLSEVPVFSTLSASDLAELINLATNEQFEKGGFICWQDEPWPYAAYIIEGSMEWSMLSPDGKRQLVFRLEACDTVWGHTIFDGNPMPASLEAITPAQILRWHKDEIIPIISRNPAAWLEITKVLVTYMRHVREVLYGFAFHPVAGRLARLLLNHYQPEEGQTTPRDLTLDTIADNIGTTPELVSRILHRFASDGLIEISRLQLVFKDREQLEILAGKE